MRGELGSGTAREEGRIVRTIHMKVPAGQVPGAVPTDVTHD